MGFEIIGAQTQDTSPNVRIKKKAQYQCSALNSIPKMQARNEGPIRPFKRLTVQSAQGICIRGKHPIPTKQESRIFPNYRSPIIPNDTESYQLSLINRLTTRKENPSPNGRNIRIIIQLGKLS